jgi:hypothetical protein
MRKSHIDSLDWYRWVPEEKMPIEVARIKARNGLVGDTPKSEFRESLAWAQK